MLDTFLILAETASHAGEAAEAAPYQSFLNDLLPGFGLDERLILSQIISFAIVAVLLWKFAYKPVVATLEERQRKIADGLKFAEDAKRHLAEAEKSQAEIVQRANAEAQRVLHEARENARQFEEAQRAETARQMEEFRRRTEETLERERVKMLSDVRQEIARLVVLTSGRVLGKELTADERSRFNEAAGREMANLN